MRRGHRVLAALASLAASLLSANGAAAQATLVTGLGGPADVGMGMLPPDDDELSVEVDVLPAFPDGLTFFGTTYDSFWVNTNGNISFGMPIMSWTPRPFPIAAQPMIALWWADVDTLGGPQPEGGNTVYYHVEPGRIVVTWLRVGYWDVHTDPADSFQLILTAAAGPLGSFDAELRYAQCEWSTADSSGGSGGLPLTLPDTCVVAEDCPDPPGSGSEPGYLCVLGHCVGTPAQAGYDAGNLTDFLALPGSRTPEILELCTRSNVTPPDPGVWRFDDELRTPMPVCGNTFRETGEECDDGNVVAEDGCSPACDVERCGDGVTQTTRGETCDDGNAASGDGCSSSCVREPCSGAPMDGELCDAGPRPDASGVDAARFDAGPPEISVGGSGCSCRAGGRGAPPSLGVWLLLALLGIARSRTQPRPRL